MKKTAFAFLTLFFVVSVAGQVRDLTRYVNPFIGTGGHGHTFPGATVPFGMVQLSPDTRIDNWDGSSGYHYSDDVIYGFSHTHLSGTGIPDGCDILFMPTVGEAQFFAKEGDKSVNGYASKFSHANEKAEPGYYSVKLVDDNIHAELTATERVGFHRYTFPENRIPRVLLDINWRDKLLDGKFSITPNRRGIQGYRESSSWAKSQKVYFVVEFSSEFEFMPTVQHKNGEIWTPERFAKSDYFPIDPIRANFSFKNVRDQQLMVKVAISYVSIEGARKNLAAELPGWDFDKVRAEARAAWNKELSKTEVSGGTPEQTTNFYTALYHTMIHPNVFNDVDGRYKGHDGKIHQLPGYAAQPPYLRRSFASPAGTANPSGGSAAASSGRQSREPNTRQLRKSGAFPQIDGRSPGEQYTVFSLWDTFRAAHPLYTIIDQKRTVDFINTFIRIYEQGGRLPVWELWGEETDTMIGYHAVSVIADAMAKNIKGFDYEKAYAAAKHSAELDHFGLAAYKKRGYISSEDENESVSKTLEYAYNDWCIAAMGATLYNMRSLSPGAPRQGDAAYLKALETDINRYQRRSLSFVNLFDTESGFFRPRRNGGFIAPFAPQEVTFHFTEGNSWQYSFFVPHDVERLMQLMGGSEKFINKLDELFTTDAKLSGRHQPDITGLMGQYAHGNEPSHHIAYLYNYAGVPSKTQARVRRILDEFYKPTPDGLIGNEDCGQMSAWYVMSASGFYPVLPGDRRYDIGTPLFKQVTFNLENGKKFIVRAPKVSAKNFYIRSAKWNGAPVAAYITQDHIMAGGVLELEMDDAPNDKAFAGVSTASVYGIFAAAPVISGDRVFKDRTQVSMRTVTRNAAIHYTTDGSVPTRSSTVYSGPFSADSTVTIKAIAVTTEGDSSAVSESTFTKRNKDWSVTLASQYSTQYTGSGVDAIIDGLRGTANFASGEWQGYEGKTFEAVIDLKRPTRISTVGGSFLQATRSWIWMPARIEFESSDDGVNFTTLAEIKTDVSQQDEKPQSKEFLQQLTVPVNARFIRVRAYNIGKIPAWHPGAGGDPWIFIDEVIIE